MKSLMVKKLGGITGKKVTKDLRGISVRPSLRRRISNVEKNKKIETASQTSDCSAERQTRKKHFS